MTTINLDDHVEAEAKVKRVIEQDPIIAALYNNTPAQVEQWVNNNVNSLAQAKPLLVALAKAMSFLLRNYRP